MFNILVIASTDAILKHTGLFREHGFDCDFLVAETGRNYDFGHFKSQTVLFHKQMTSVTERETETPSQKIQRHLVAPQLISLEKQIYEIHSLLTKKNAPFKLSNNQIKSDFNIFTAADILDLAYDRSNKKMSLEVKNKGVYTYDHILVEDSDLAFEYLNNTNPKLLEPDQENHFLWAGLSYKLSQPLIDKKFWFVHDVNYESHYDNWYFLNSRGQSLDVWTWIPAQQKNNQEYFDFFSKRIQKRIETEFQFLSASQVSSTFQLQPLNSGTSFKMAHDKLATLIPSFPFYSDAEIQNAVRKSFATVISKLKVKKELYEATV